MNEEMIEDQVVYCLPTMSPAEAKNVSWSSRTKNSCAADAHAK